MIANTLTHNTRHPIEPSELVNSEYCEDGSELVRLLLAELEAAGIVLWINAGRLAFDAPAGVMTDERFAGLRADRDAVFWWN